MVLRRQMVSIGAADGVGWRQGGLRATALVAAGLAYLASHATPARAVSIQLKDVAADRIERQRAAAEGALPLSGTPDMSAFDERMHKAGVKLGSPIFIRAFKAESELELWIMKDGRYTLFANYPVCQWSGTIGPKVRETDKQTPEGFYTVNRRLLHRSARHPKALNLGFPNAFDKSFARTGSYLLIHGGCSSVGCFAMTDTIIEEIWRVAEAALKEGQEQIPVHVFPFRMSDSNMERHKNSEWKDFWANLKEGYDAFERTNYPPKVSVCERRYSFQDIAPPEVGDAGPLAVCGETLAAIQKLEPFYSPVPALHPFRSRALLIQRARLLQASLAQQEAAASRRGGSAASQPSRRPQSRLASRAATPCSPTLVSCRRFLELKHRRAVVMSKARANSFARARATPASSRTR